MFHPVFFDIVEIQIKVVQSVRCVLLLARFQSLPPKKYVFLLIKLSSAVFRVVVAEK